MTGDETRGGGTDELVVRVELVHARWRHFGWTLFGFVVGGFMLVHGGWGARLLGLGLVLFTLGSLRDFIATYQHAPGTFELRGDRVRLPKGLCTGETLDLPWSDVRHAYILRRTLSFASTGALLVIETTSGMLEYPREWFWGDGDQRQVVRAIAARPVPPT